MSSRLSCLLAALWALFWCSTAFSEGGSIILQSTTSTQNSGLYEEILPLFTDTTGIKVRVVAVGTGQALKNAADCNADVLIVHDKKAEERFVEAGFAGKRFDLMTNDFVIVGPEADPVDIASESTVHDVFRRIRDSAGIFVSRGDNSGTHAREREVWQSIGKIPRSSWYRETGSGMGATLNISVGMGGYTLADRATWIRFGNKASHRILFEGGPGMLNQYGIMAVSETHCPNIDADSADVFVRWMLSDRGQSAIRSYRVDGRQMFVPNASRN